MRLDFLDHPTVEIFSYAVAAVTAFVKLGDVPLDARFVVVGLLCLYGYLVFARRSWKWMASSGHRFWRLVGLVLACGTLIAISVSLFYLTTVYHNVVYVRRPASGFSAGTLSFRPPRSPCSLHIDISVLQRGDAHLDEVIPSSCNPENRAHWGVAGQDPYEQKFEIADFVHPQCFEVSYRTSGPQYPLIVQTSAGPSAILVLGPEQSAGYHLIFLVTGGAIWFVSVVVLSWRWCGLRHLP
jgi:hypothetical protein